MASSESGSTLKRPLDDEGDASASKSHTPCEKIAKLESDSAAFPEESSAVKCEALFLLCLAGDVKTEVVCHGSGLS